MIILIRTIGSNSAVIDISANCVSVIILFIFNLFVTAFNFNFILNDCLFFKNVSCF